MPLWNTHFELDEDSHDDDVEAATIEEAARIVYDEWHSTPWQSAAVYGPDYALSIDLTEPEFNAVPF